MNDLSPLQEIERTVLARAAELRLSTGDQERGAQLRGLIEDEVARWSLDY